MTSAGAIDNLLDHYEEVGERALVLSAARGEDAMGEFAKEGRSFTRSGSTTRSAPGSSKRGSAERKRIRGALIALCDVQTWAILSRDLGYPRAQVRATLITAIERLLLEETT